MSENNTGPHLPPPAFPPGVRRHIPFANGAPWADEPDGAAAAAAGPDGVPLISPDDPFPPRIGAVDDAMTRALISPDEPLPPRTAASEPASLFPGDPMPERGDGTDRAGAAPSANGLGEGLEEGIATGLNDDPHLHAPEFVPVADPHVASLLDAVTRLAGALKATGESGLRVTPQMSAFEATLRAYCAGYLAARRDGDGPALPHRSQGD